LLYGIVVFCTCLGGDESIERNRLAPHGER
jgi:hypothetical protein